MGRYYNGDIEGKFWFAIQPSDDADFFMFTDGYRTHLQYYFVKSNLEGIEEGIRICLEKLGDNKKKLDDFFSKKNSYNEKMIEDETGIKEEDCKGVLEWYARLELGEKILKCVKEKGVCRFSAEL